MRKDTLITIIMIMGVISIFTSCNPHPNLSKADQLINFYPDSSLTYLKAIQHPENMSPKDYAKWCLLVAQAKYNNAQSLVPDSFVFKAFDYFSKDTSDPILTARTYFYTALISKEIRNIEEAAQYLLKARDFAEKANDYNLAFKISHDLCDIYSKQGLFDYKLTEAWRGYNYAQISKDSLSIYYALADLGHAYSTKEQIDSALYFFEKAFPIAQKVHPKATSSALNDICYAYINKKDYISALKICNEAIACEKDSIDRYNNYIIKGVIFQDIQQYDSAIHYFTLSSKNQYIYAKALSYSYLGEIYEKKGNILKALEFIKTYELLRDSIEDQNQSVAIIKMQNLFQNEKLQKNNKELSKKMEEISSLVYKISAIAAFALLITGLCYFITYKKKSERIRKQEREISQAKDKLQQQAIENLQKEEKLSSLQADFLRRLVAINIPSLNNKANDLVIKLSNEDFANLEKDINATFDQFTVRLKKEYPLLDKNEIQFCCLIKIQLDLNTLANIYCRSKAAISKRKLRIKQEKLNITDKNISLDDFIQRFRNIPSYINIYS